MAYLPDAKKFDQDVARETRGEHLRNNEDIRRQRRFQHDGHIRCVEQFNGIRATLTTESVRFDRNLNAESLEVDDHCKNNDGSNEIHNIRQSVPPKCLSQRPPLIVPREQQMEKGHNGTLKLGSSPCIDSRR